MSAQFKNSLPLEEVINGLGKVNGLPGACGDTFSQLLKKYGPTIGTDKVGGCTNCMQIFICQIFDWRKAFRLDEEKSSSQVFSTKEHVSDFERLGALVEKHPLGRPTPHGGCVSGDN